MSLRSTVLLPIIRPPYFLPNSIKSVLAQTVSEFELFVVCDGAPPETIECAQEFARRDPRVKVFPFLKGERQGEAHLHAVLANASGKFVAYLEDDDLWFPNHLEELEKLFLTVDFGHTIHVLGHPDGHVESLPSDLGRQEFRQRFLDDLFNRFGYSFCGHTLDAYRRLPEGWKPAPLGMFNDLHMWRKFLRVNEFNFGTRMVITAIALPNHRREHMSLEELAREADDWVSRIVDEQERANIVEAAWRSVVGKEIDCEQEILKGNSSHREAKAALAQMEAMHPGSLQKLGHAIEVEANAQLQFERLTDVFNLCQQALTITTARSEAQEAAIAAYQADLADLNGRLAAATQAQATAQLEVKRLTDLYTLSQQRVSLLIAKTEAQEAAIAAYQADLAKVNGKLAELKAAYERIIRSRSWRLTQPLRSAAAMRLSQILGRDKT
jgi:glycosyltransferase involved in cell wall biosynthesis